MQDQTAGRSLHARFDVLGAIVASACAVHCMAMPLLVALLPAIGLGFLLNESVEQMLVFGSVCLALASVGWGYTRHRRAWSIVWVLAASATLLTGAFAFGHDGCADAAIVSAHAEAGHAHGCGAGSTCAAEAGSSNLPFLLMAAGGFGLAIGHLVNRRMCDACVVCGTQHAEGEPHHPEPS